MMLLTRVIVGVWNYEHFELVVCVPMVVFIRHGPTLFPGTAIRVVKR